MWSYIKYDRNVTDNRIIYSLSLKSLYNFILNKIIVKGYIYFKNSM